MQEKLKDFETFNKYFIDIFKNSQSSIIILTLKILIPVLIISILVKYIFKKKDEIRYLVMVIWAYYVSSLLHVTLLNRIERTDVWDKIYEGWGIGGPKEHFEAIENVVMLFPIIFLFLIGVGRIFFKKRRLWVIMLFSFLVSGFITLNIEFSQVKYLRGTFQYADIVYNILGGCVGGFMYWVLTRLKDLLNKIIERE